MEEDAVRDTCLRLELIGDDPKAKNVVFVKGTWFPSRFDLFITDGNRAWTCQASEADVRQRADQWDQPVAEYLKLAEQYLGFQQPGSVYRFEDAGKGERRLSWTFEKQGTKLEWRWKCQPSANDKQTTTQILDFLMDANIWLSEEVVRKTQSFEKLKLEAQKCLDQSENLAKERTEFESTIYSKFVAVLNSKKAKLRELRDRISKLETSEKKPSDEEEREEETSDKTVSFDEETRSAESKEEITSDVPDTSEHTSVAGVKGQKRKSRK